MEILFDIANLEIKAKEYEKETEKSDFWSSANSTELLTKLKRTQNKIEKFYKLKQTLNNIEEMNELLLIEYDEDLSKNY